MSQVYTPNTSAQPLRQFSTLTMPPCSFLVPLARVLSIALSFSLAFLTGQSLAQTPRQSLHRVGPLNSNHHFPDWYQDRSGLALEIGTALTFNERLGGWVLLPTTSFAAPERYVYPPKVPDTFSDEHFYFYAANTGNVNIPAGASNPIVIEMALEAAFSSGTLVVNGDQIVFTRTRITLKSAPFSGSYTLETPYRTYVINNQVAGKRIRFTDDFGIGVAPEGFTNCLNGPIGPFLLPADQPGGKELPPVTFEGRSYLADPTLTYPVTGSPLGKNFVRLTGPSGQLIYYADRFQLIGRIKTGPVPSDIKVVRASKFVTQDERRIDVFAKSAPTLHSRLPAQPSTITRPHLDLFLAPPLQNPTSGILSVPTTELPVRMSDNGPTSSSYHFQSPNLPFFPAAMTARDDSGVISRIPLVDSVLITKADYSPASKSLTVQAASANVAQPVRLFLIGVDGVPTNTSFTSSIQIPNLSAPPHSVTVISSQGGAATALVTVGVPPGAYNHPPIASADSAELLAGDRITIPVLNNDSDPDHDTLFIGSVSQPNDATVETTDNGTTLTVTATPNAHGEIEFQYNTIDRRGGTATATVTLLINRSPSTRPDSSSGLLGQPIPIEVLSNDSDADGDPLTITSFSIPQLGDVPLGLVSITDSGKSLSYVPISNLTKTHAFTYTVADGRRGSAIGSVEVQVDTPPTAFEDAFFDNDRKPVLLDVLSNDNDADGDTIELVSVSSNPRATITIVGGLIQFSPLPTALPIETFDYTIRDSLGATATSRVTVLQNQSPSAVADSYVATAGIPKSLDLLANDTDPDHDDLLISSVSTSPGNQVSIEPNQKSVLFTFAPTATGPAVFTYQISDPRGGTATGSVTVGLNRVPLMVADSASTSTGVPVIVKVLANDTDPDGDPLTITAVSTPTQGSTKISDAGKTITFTPNANSSIGTGLQSFTYSVSDGRGATATGNVSVKTSDRVTITQADYITSLKSWVLIGTAGPGATLTLKAGTSLIGTATADIRGAWKVTSAVTPDPATNILASSSQGGSAQKAITFKP